MKKFEAKSSVFDPDCIYDFNWDETPEGSIFWTKVAVALRDKTKFPRIPKPLKSRITVINGERGTGAYTVRDQMVKGKRVHKTSLQKLAIWLQTTKKTVDYVVAEFGGPFVLENHKLFFEIVETYETTPGLPKLIFLNGTKLLGLRFRSCGYFLEAYWLWLLVVICLLNTF